jgi:phosphoribosylamine--glycine ligase
MIAFGTACEDKKAYDDNSSDLNFFRKFRNRYYRSFYKNGPTSRNMNNIFPLTMNPNTGGMIGVAQSPYVDEESVKEIMNTIVEPTFGAYRGATGHEWKGIAYFGLLLVRDGDKITRKVSEFNARDGDTEMELRMPLLETSLYEIGSAYVEDRLDEMEIKWRESWTLGLALVSGRLPREFYGDYSDLEDVANDSIGFVKDQNLGYPWPHVTNQPIIGLDQVKKVHVFGAGIALNDNQGEGVKRSEGKLEFCTSGGRTMVLVGEGNTINEAERVVYDEQEKIFYANKRYRKTHVDWTKPLSTF